VRAVNGVGYCPGCADTLVEMRKPRRRAPPEEEPAPEAPDEAPEEELAEASTDPAPAQEEPPQEEPAVQSVQEETSPGALDAEHTGGTDDEIKTDPT